MQKIKCDYCGGTTPDDSRGNCYACGAPRVTLADMQNYNEAPREWFEGMQPWRIVGGPQVSFYASTTDCLPVFFDGQWKMQWGSEIK